MVVPPVGLPVVADQSWYTKAGSKVGPSRPVVVHRDDDVDRARVVAPVATRALLAATTNSKSSLMKMAS